MGAAAIAFRAERPDHLPARVRIADVFNDAPEDIERPRVLLTSAVVVFRAALDDEIHVLLLLFTRSLCMNVITMQRVRTRPLDAAQFRSASH